MALQYDPHTSEISYEGKVIGKYVYIEGVARVQFDITYECGQDEWVVPLSWFDYGLNQLEKHKPRNPVIALVVETSSSDIEEEFEVVRFLTEKTVKQDGYVWRFHKTDSDTWPSLLHAHDYDQKLVLDALTGDIYDTMTRQRCKRLSQKGLEQIYQKLRASRDFADKLNKLVT
ncbi:MAG TPA: hypothetical protein VNJ47_07185 [Nevskiales bacterium]|nr:hypothetical protein [Nevskiales bacterium]